MVPNTDIVDLFRLVDFKHNHDSLIKYKIEDIDKDDKGYFTLNEWINYKIHNPSSFAVFLDIYWESFDEELKGKDFSAEDFYGLLDGVFFEFITTQR